MTNCDMYAVKSQSVLVDKIPFPPAFEIRKAPFRVPPFFPSTHGETIWIMNMVNSEKWDRIQRMAALNPDYFRTAYFQVADRPLDGMPMFHSSAVLYLNPLGLAIYMKKPSIVHQMCSFIDKNGYHLVDANDMCFVANIYERGPGRSDLLLFYPFCVAIRRECYECVTPLMDLGWQPHVNVMLPYRKPYRCFSFHYRDFLDYTLAQLWHKPSLRLSYLIKEMFRSYRDNFNPLSYEKVPSKYRDTEIQDWLSFPRRLLRFAYYYDLNLRTACGVLTAVEAFCVERFFVAPTRSCFEVDVAQRSQLIPPNGGNREERNLKIVFDQDNIIALLLGLLERCIIMRSHTSRDKVLKVLIKIIADTKWLLLFLTMTSSDIIGYFTNLIEDVTIEKDTVHEVVNGIIPAIASSQLEDSALEDLCIPGGITKGDWRTAIELFIDAASQGKKEGS